MCYFIHMTPRYAAKYSGHTTPDRVSILRLIASKIPGRMSSLTCKRDTYQLVNELIDILETSLTSARKRGWRTVISQLIDDMYDHSPKDALIICRYVTFRVLPAHV